MPTPSMHLRPHGAERMLILRIGLALGLALLLVIGGILWFTIGRRRANDNGGEIRIVAPDDDPQFLRSISKSEQEARIRRLEEELARLEDETDDGAAPDGPAPAGTAPDTRP